MTNPTLERAARALAQHFGCEWGTMRDADREMIRGYCRAVLMAVREPDGTLADALYESEGDNIGIWTDGIDAILADGGE